MATIRFEIEGNDMVDIIDTMQTMVPYKTQENILQGMPLQELLLYADQRCQAEGYEMEVKRPQATAKKEEARARLRGDLEASVKLEETRAEEPETPATTMTKKVMEAAIKGAAPKKAGNGKGETDTQMKAQCIKTLQALYASGRKTEVNKILAEYGDGAKNFNVIPEDRFGPIKQAIEALPA